MKNGLKKLTVLMAVLMATVLILTFFVLTLRDKNGEGKAEPVSAIDVASSVAKDAKNNESKVNNVSKEAEVTKEPVIAEDSAEEKLAKSKSSKEENPVKNTALEDVSADSISSVESKEEYYQENSTVVEVIEASRSEETPAEDEVIVMLRERGFTRFPVTYEYAEGGEYEGTTEITGDSKKTHPIYQTYFEAENGDIWTIFVINGSVMANPASYNLRSPHSAQLLFSESEKLTSYDNQTDQYYVTIPNDSAVIVKTVDRIDATTINSITDEEMDNL